MLDKGTTLYSFGEISPEMIWDFGSSLADLKTENNIKIPNNETFGVLVAQVDENEFKRIFGPEYMYELIGTFDLNPYANPGSKAHKGRLANNLYIVKKQ
ncbi:hypothetical protein GCM10007383_18470 [Arenibacter certesii]|uniref:Uncharacterized protein n=2 Tax=Arenibacter certesii TaxID=228955 RepID=A0A918MKL4_9FLAO|nr:hypothetical protein GCM10007383_18470 [Arenibacter certesii]